jgi:voltage-gated potassium channel
VARLRDLGDRYTAWIDRHEIAWELTMAMLAIAFVVVGILLGNAEDAGEDAALLTAIDLALTAVFAAEFSSRLLAARDRTRYIGQHWIDALALIPTVRAIRLLRLLRLLRLVRSFAGMFRALSSLERFAKHRGLVALFLAWLGVAFISAAAFYFAEASSNPEIHSPIDAIWWAIVTLTTVGYGDLFPVTPEGRLAGSALMIVGITLWAAITGTITSLLISSSAADASVPEKIRQLKALVDEELLSDAEFEAKKSELLARM